jgi:hypothetical protein
MAVKKKKLPAKKAVKKKVQPAKKAVDPEKLAIVEGNNILMKFQNNVKYVNFHDGTIAPIMTNLYKKVYDAVQKAKFNRVSMLLQGLERHKRTVAIEEALMLSARTGKAMPLWIELVRTVKWLKNKNK